MSISYKLKRIGVRVLPRNIINVLKRIEIRIIRIQGFYYAHKKFNFNKAQKYELDFGIGYMKKGGFFEQTYHYLQLARQQGPGSVAVYERLCTTNRPSFFTSKSDFDDFCKNTQNKTCLEIGAATEGVLVLMPWIKKRVSIDPLIKKYRQEQLDKWGKTALTDDMFLYDQCAEDVIPELVGSVDGFIISRNTLDHAAEPWNVLKIMGNYAKSGCILLFWTDIWHLEPLNEGHRNLTKDPKFMEKKIEEAGFRVVRILPDSPEVSGNIHYGCVAVKI